MSGRPLGEAIGLPAALFSLKCLIAAMLALYKFGVAPTEVGEGIRSKAQEKIAAFGVNTKPVFFGLALFYSLGEAMNQF